MKTPILASNIKAVLSDIDGTLVDSNDAHAQAWERALDKFGFVVPFEKVREKIGMGGDHLLPALTGLVEDSEIGKRISDYRGELFKAEYLPKLKAFPGARLLLKSLRDRGLRLVAATSGSAEDLKGILKQADLEGLFDEAVTSSEADKSKPNADILRAALKKAAVQASEAIMIGDTPYDIEAALDLGLPVVAFTCGGWGKEELLKANSIYESPTDFLVKLERQWQNS